MELRPLGRTGLSVSTISLGAMNFDGRTDPKTAERMLLTAVDAGVNLVDTADLYHRAAASASASTTSTSISCIARSSIPRRKRRFRRWISSSARARW